jgi:hypothetical protein
LLVIVCSCSVALDAGADSDDSDGIERGSDDGEEESADDAMDIDSEEEGGEADDEKRGGNRAGGMQLKREAKDEKKGGERKEAKANDPLAPNGQQWTVIDAMPAEIGRRSLYSPGLNVQSAYTSVKAKLSLNNEARLIPLDFFYCLFPMPLLSACVTSTAAAWEVSRLGMAPPAGEILLFIGFIIAFSVDGRPVADHWPGSHSAS